MLNTRNIFIYGLLVPFPYDASLRIVDVSLCQGSDVISVRFECSSLYCFRFINCSSPASTPNWARYLCWRWAKIAPKVSRNQSSVGHFKGHGVKLDSYLTASSVWYIPVFFNFRWVSYGKSNFPANRILCPLLCVRYLLSTHNWWIIILVNYTLFAPFTVSVNPYTDTVIINLTRRLSFRIKTTQRFLSVSSRGQHMPT